MAISQAAVIGLVALILTPGALFYFDVTPKVLALLLGVAVLPFLRSRGADRRFTLLLAASFASAAISTFISDRPWISLFGSTWRRYGLVSECAVLLFAWFVSQLPNGRAVVRGISIATSAAALYGVAQYFGWDPILPAAAYHIGEGTWTIVRPPGTLGYVSYFATWLLIAGFLSLSLRNRAGYAAAALCWCAMALTGTRAAILGLAAGFVLCSVRAGYRPSRRALAMFACGLAAGGAFWLSPAGWNLRSRGRWFAEDPWGGARLLLWRDSARMASRRPAFGHGLETFTATFPAYESAELARAYPDFAHESPHNVFLDALVSQGIFGLFCLGALCVMGLRASDPWLAAAVAGGLVAQQFTTFTLPTALLFYTTVALTIPKPAAPVRLPRFALAPLSAVFLLVAVRLAAADFSLARTQRALASADLAAADAHYREYRARKLPGASADLWCSQSLFAVAQRSPTPLLRVQALQMAGAVGADAAKTSEEPFNAWYNLANVRAAQGDAVATESALRNAELAKPRWFKPHWMLAQLFRLEGRVQEATAEAAIAKDLNGGRNQEVAATLDELRQSRH